VNGNDAHAGSGEDFEMAGTLVVDTTAPSVTDVSVTDALLQDDDDGDTFTVTVTFSEDMNQSVNPTLTFNPNVVGATLIAGSTGWLNATTYAANFTVDDTNVDIASVTIDVTNAQDLAGNAQADYAPVHEFEVDMVPPNAAPVAGDDIVLTNIVDGSTIIIPEEALLSNDTDGDLDTLTIDSVQNSSGGNAVLNSVDFTPTPLGAPVSVFNVDFSGGAADLGGFAYSDNFFGGTGTDANGVRDAAGNGNAGALHIDLGGVDNGDETNMNGAFTRSFNLAVAAQVTITFDYRARLDGATDAGENVQVRARIDGTDLGTSGVVHQLNGVNTTDVDLDSGWQTFSVTLNLGAGNHTLALGGLMSAKTQSDEFADVDFDNVSVTTQTFSSGSFEYTATDGIDNDDGSVSITGQNSSTITGGAGDEILIGGPTSDLLLGGLGSDIYSFGMTTSLTDTINDAGGAADKIFFNTNGAALAVFNVESIDLDLGAGTGTDDLMITHHSGIIQIADQSDIVSASNSNPGPGAIEKLAFLGGATYFGYALTGEYNLGGDRASPVDGTSGRDILASDSGAETVNGDAGDDVMFGNGNNDIMNGGAGSDLILGGSGNDTIDGGTEDDWIVGGGNADTITGGGGSDRFIWTGTTDAGDILNDFLAGLGGDFLEFVLTGSTLGAGFTLANQGTPTNTPNVVTVTVAGGAGTSIAGADVIIWNVGTVASADTAAEINTLLAAQNGDFNGGVLVAAYNGTDVAIYHDSDANSTGSGNVTTLVATLDLVNATSQLDPSQFHIIS
jgi:hypothetical protein